MTKMTDALLGVLAWIGGAAILLLTLHVGVGVILRTAFDIQLPMTYEIVTQYYMVALAFIPIAWVEHKGGMVAVELIDGFLPDSANRFLDTFVAVFSTLVYAALTWFTWTAAIRNFKTGTYVLVNDVYLPLWPGYFLLPLGFFVATLITLLRVFTPKTSVTP
jgi:TRAP-type C4-dicarboxylate transport system permease small subunit